MVCLYSNPEGSEELLRKGARAATQMNAEWYAVHLETPSESVQKISTADFRSLLNNINLAADVGAEVVWLKSPDVVKARSISHGRKRSRASSSDERIRLCRIACRGSR